MLAFIDATGAKSIVMTDRISAVRTKKASITKAPLVRHACSGPDAIAGLADAYTNAVARD